MQTILTKKRWIVLLATVLAQCCCNFPNVWGVFQPYVANVYGYSADAATLVMPLCVAAFGVFSIFGGRVQDTHSPRTAALIGTVMISASFFIGSVLPAGNPLLFYFGFSMFFGGGCGFVNGGLFPCLMKWYADKKGFAGGVMSAVAAAFSILLTYLCDTLLGGFGPRKTLAGIGVVCMVVLFVTSLCYVNPTDAYIQEKSALAPGGKKEKNSEAASIDFTTAEMLRTKQYYLLILCMVFAMPAVMLINPALVSIGMERGLSKAMSLNALAIASGAAAAGRFLVPWISDHAGRKRTLLIMWGATALASFWFMKAGGFGIVAAFAVVAFVNNGGFTIIGPLTNDLFGFRYSGTNMGFVNIANSAGALIGPLLLTFFTPLLGADARSWIAIVGAVLAFVCVLVLSTNMAAVRRKMDEKPLPAIEN